MLYLYNVPTKKGVLVTVRISENTRDKFKIAAELRGATMSGLLHQYIVRTVREEQEAQPGAFANERSANGKDSDQKEIFVPVADEGGISDQAVPKRRSGRK